MSSSLKNIVLILSFVILLPVTLFIALEIGTLNENEQMLEEVYREQLDAVIFSVNQYSGDLFDFYINQIDFQWRQSNNSELVDSTFVQQNLAISTIAALNDRQQLNRIDLKAGVSLTDKEIIALIDEQQDLCDRLIRYKETGYIKPETLNILTSADSQVSAKLIIIGKATPCVIFLDPVLFIEDLLAPKIQQIASQNLNISVRRINENTEVYSNTSAHSSIVQTKALSILENFEILVSLQSQSVSELIKFRTKQSIISLALLILMIVLGVILVVRNLRREMQLSKAKADFVANVSHEIRTPLSLISMFNETLLLDRVKDEKKKKEYYEIIAKETSRLKNIVNKILSFSQIDAQKKQFNFQVIQPDQIVEEVMDTYSYHLKENDFDFNLNLTGNTSIYGDHEALVEVVINLIDNAIKYSKEKRHIELSSHVDQDSYVLEVKDEGVGIHRKDQEKVFEKFFRVDGGDIHNTKGTGLGLSLITEIVKAHGGSIHLKSNPGMGSTFILKFPIHHE